MTEPGIGHNNPPVLPSAANRDTAFYLLGREYLVTAIQDHRLERSHLRVLACLVLAADRENYRVWPRRAEIAAQTGYAPKTVSNILVELRGYGYIVQDVIEGDEVKRSAIPYTFGNIDHDTIRREITAWVRRYRDTAPASDGRSGQDANVPACGEQKSPPTGNFPACGEQISPRLRGTLPRVSPPAGNTKVPAHGELPRLRGTSKSPPAGNVPKISNEINDGHERTSPPAGNSELSAAYNKSIDSQTLTSSESKTLIDANLFAQPKARRGARLPDGWVLTKPMGEWAMANFHVTADQVREQASMFRDYWTSKAGASACKVDWMATWRNWCRNAKGWRRRPTVAPVDDLLASVKDDIAEYNAEYQAEWDKARAISMIGDDDADR